MKYIEIIAPCCIAGKNYTAADLIPCGEISETDENIVCGSCLARIVERYPVTPDPAFTAKIDEETKAAQEAVPADKPAKNAKKTAKK